MERGFGMDPADVAELLASDRGRTLLVERDGVPLASLRLSRDGNTGAIHGFVVDPDHQGQGIGRDVLRRACDLLRAEGAELVRLEVEVSNDRALGLYESVGFSVLTTEDYYRLPTRVLSPTAQ
jgi:ribosomal protein S18 acetylase RimI-like enzyme